MPAALRYLTLADPSEPARPRHLAYFEWGDPANPDCVVCAHGLTRNARDFDFLADALAERYRVICVDVAGRGRSDWLASPSDYNYGTYHLDALTMLDRLGLERVRWVGTSMGGIIGMRLAAEEPHRILRLVLNDIGSVVAGAGLKRILTYAGAANVFASADAAMAHLRGVLAPFAIGTETGWQHMFAASFNPLPDGRYAAAYDPAIGEALRQTLTGDTIVDVDLTGAWERVRCPVLLLRGAKSDILSRATAESMCRRPQETRLLEFAEAGHAPSLLDPAQIGAVKDWLAGGA